jgi:Family of unknown function (DUF5681)
MVEEARMTEKTSSPSSLSQDPAAEDPTYDVGYCKPPKHTRFKPEHSGNPRGRARGTRNLKTDLAEELAERIPITEGGRKRSVSKQRAMVKQLMAKALKGDVRAASIILDCAERLLGARTDAHDEAPPADVQAILDAYVERRTLGKNASASSPVLAPPELLDDDAPDSDEK